MESTFKPRQGVSSSRTPGSNKSGNPSREHQYRKAPVQDGPRVNNEITAPKVRVVGENIQNPGIYSFSEAIKMAEALELDLVEISPNADPPVCKIVDYQKYLYQQKKKAKEMKSNASKVVIKEIRFGPNTDEHDYQFKLKHAQAFLQEGCKVKAFVFFKGRSIIFSDQGEKLLLRFALDLEDYGKAEQMPKLEGKRMIMMLAPIKKK
ncbi:MAG TPA: translation initiation factor IF-3 [Bacteroidales bacterium]|nr:translation initiation factor IF-3 [Bacteroidales bacterium]HRR49094.1 translation initiation factor IF-3 [Bacteroidales bacterium]HRT33188.1 translation initiation factor IF-3 [Bacteroidales bacterium]HRT83710.1 translation initiation factor IF-3 [Bacteroidales bacterium]